MIARGGGAELPLANLGNPANETDACNKLRTETKSVFQGKLFPQNARIDERAFHSFELSLAGLLEDLVRGGALKETTHTEMR